VTNRFIAALRASVLPASLSLSLLALGACGDRGEAEKQARAFFKQREPQLAAIVASLSKCSGDGTMSIFPKRDGSYVRTSLNAPECSNADDISAGLQAANVRHAYITGDPPYGTPTAMGAIFLLASPDDYDNNQISAIDYYADAKSDAGPHSTPLTPTPTHWFFRYISAEAVNPS
jgi:hypothetical protein